MAKIHTPDDTMENVSENGFKNVYRILNAYLSTREVYSSFLNPQTPDPAIKYLLPGAGIFIITTAIVFFILNKNMFWKNNV